MCFSFVAAGSLVFGVISAIFTGIASLVHLGIIIALNIYPNDVKDYYLFRTASPPVVGAANVLLVAVTVKFLVDFFFAVLLCDGICKKNAGYVEAYFTYGIMMAVLCALVDIAAFAIDWQDGLTILVILAAFCLILHMIRMAIKEMAASRPGVQTAGGDPLEAC